MKSKTWKFLTVLVILALTIPALAGCAQKTPEPTTAPENTGTNNRTCG
jgi:predicted small lipoprotein YifL